jgi:Spy/CpxP family protein refolding chaperone
MKLNKTLTLVALVAGGLFAGSLALQAQDAPTTPPPGGQAGPGARGRGPTLEQLTKELTLTADQTPKVKAALEARDQKMKDLRADTSLSQEDRRAKMKTIRDDFTTAMKGILTADQFTAFQKLQPAGRGRPGGAGAPPATPPAAGK